VKQMCLQQMPSAYAMKLVIVPHWRTGNSERPVSMMSFSPR